MPLSVFLIWRKNSIFKFVYKQRYIFIFTQLLTPWIFSDGGGGGGGGTDKKNEMTRRAGLLLGYASIVFDNSLIQWYLAKFEFKKKMENHVPNHWKVLPFKHWIYSLI